MNRSYQETIAEYKSIDRYFKKFFRDADVCVLSSHPSEDDIAEMISQLKRRCYNVGGIFWSNPFGARTEEISLLPWDEKLWIENPQTSGDAVTQQLNRIANHFSQFLIAHTRGQ